MIFCFTAHSYSQYCHSGGKPLKHVWQQLVFDNDPCLPELSQEKEKLYLQNPRMMSWLFSFPLKSHVLLPFIRKINFLWLTSVSIMGSLCSDRKKNPRQRPFPRPPHHIFQSLHFWAFCHWYSATSCAFPVAFYIILSLSWLALC